MSASAVRGGQVYVEIGANPSKLLNALRVVNTQVGNLGNAVASVGGRMAMAGTAITAPIAAAAIAFAGQNAEILNAQEALKGVGAAGTAITAPIAAAEIAFAGQNTEILKAQEALKGVGAAVGEAVAPAFVGMAKIVTGAATSVQRFIRDNQQLVRLALSLGGALVASGAGLSLFGRSLRDLSTVAGVIGKPLGLVVSSLISAGNAGAAGLSSLASGLMAATSASAKMAVSLASASVSLGRLAVRGLSPLVPLARRATVAIVQLGQRAAVAAAEMAISFAVANPYLAAMAGLAAAGAVVLMSLGASAQKTADATQSAAQGVRNFGNDGRSTFDKISAAISSGQISSAITDVVGVGVQNAKILFSDLFNTASTTVTGIYNAIAAGDLGAAVDIMWAGVHAGFARGSQAVMGALDPWIETVQNAFSDFGVGLAMKWDQTWTNIATSEWGGYVLGAMDNVLNGIMATWDNTIGYLQKGWARFSGWWSGDTAKMEAEIARIDAANADNAAQRGRDRPGFAGRTGLSDEQKAKMQQESRDRMAAMQAEADKMRADRAAQTQANVQQRAQAVADANNRLQEKVGATQAPPPVDPNANAAKIKTEIVGTFSAFGIDQMGSGNVQKQQLDALLKIQAGIDQANRVGGIIA